MECLGVSFGVSTKGKLEGFDLLQVPAGLLTMHAMTLRMFRNVSPKEL